MEGRTRSKLWNTKFKSYFWEKKVRLLFTYQEMFETLISNGERIEIINETDLAGGKGGGSGAFSSKLVAVHGGIHANALWEKHPIACYNDPRAQ